MDNSRRCHAKKVWLPGTWFGSFALSLEAFFSKSNFEGNESGLVRNQMGEKHWDLPTLIRNCEISRLLGVELRTEHAHKVETNLNASQRVEVKNRFGNSPVTYLVMKILNTIES